MKWFKLKKKRSTMFQVVRNALIFVAAWGLVATFANFGLMGAVRGLANILVAVATAYLTHIIFYMVEDAKEGKVFETFTARVSANWKKVQRGVPEITALIIGIRLQIATPILIIIIASVIAELVGKLMWGGFGKNKLNPVAVSILLVRVLFDQYLLMPALPGATDAIAAATPLSVKALEGWSFTAENYALIQQQVGGLWNLLIGNFPGIMAETTRIASFIALGYMIHKKALKWEVPAFYVGTVFVGAAIIGLFHGYIWSYALYHVLSGGLVFGAIFMATDPVTIPKNKAGQIVFAILLGMLTLAIRINSELFHEGVMVGLVIMNMFTTYINEKTSALNKEPQKKQWATYGGLIAASTLIVFLLSF
ncbi:MAG: RnfABCDGE type electron transport complex subunit D [Turicibacter sp.]|nr:RnfABCDGE type electron transport complex subunit D [Turicibacter sp.]